MTGRARGVTGIGDERSARAAAVRLLRRHPRTLAFPAVALAATAAMAPVAPDAVVLVGAVAFDVLRGLPAAGVLTLVAASALVGVAAVLAAATAVVSLCNLGLAVAVDRARHGDEPSVAAGFATALRRLPHALAVGAAFGGTLWLPWLSERGTRSRRRRRFHERTGRTFRALTYLVGPAAALEDRTVVGAFDRSAALVGGRFGDDAIVRAQVMRHYLKRGLAWSALAVVGVFVAGAVVGPSAELLLERPLVRAAVVAPLWVALVYGTAVAAVFKTLLYVALREDREEVPLLGLDVERTVDVQRAE